jgi:hypothetical protein
LRCSQQRLGHLPFDRQERIERGHRVLEDHADAVAANLVQRRFVHVQQVLAAIGRGARYLAVASEETQQRHHCLALAGAGFADDAERAPRFERKRHALHRVDGCAFAARKAHAEVFDFE